MRARTNPRRIRRLRLSALAAALLLAAAQATPAQLPRQTKPIDDVVVPVPREIFRSLDRFTDSNWREVQRLGLTGVKPHGDQKQIALLLGVVIAEGFVAVAAEDSDEVKGLGNTLLRLSRGLGVEKAVIRRSRSIVDYAEQKDWPAVRREWDGVSADVQHGMNALQSEQLSHLVSLGGWLRGTEALTALLQQNYSAKNAALLRQPALLDYFEMQLRPMNHHPAVAKILDGLEKMRQLTVRPDASISEKSVRDLGALCRELLAPIVGETEAR